MGDFDHMTITWGPRSHDNHMEDLDHMTITRGGVGGFRSHDNHMGM